MAAIRRLLADLRRPETRGAALRRVRVRATSALRRSAHRSASETPATPTPRTTPKAQAGARRPDSWYVGEWSRLARTVLGPDAAAVVPSLDPATAPEVIRQARRQRAHAALAEAIGQGEHLERAVCQGVADLTDALEWNAAWALAEGVGRLPGGAPASAMGHAVLLHRRRQFARAWTLVRDLDDEALARCIPVEAVDAAFAAGTAAARQRALAIAVPTADLEADVVVDLAGRFLAFGERERAAELVAELRRRPAVRLDERRRHSWTLIERWLDRRSTSVPAGSVPVAVMDYQSPYHVRTSDNVGDYIQTLAMLGNLVRLSNVSFSGEDGLGELAAELRERVQPRLRVPDVHGSMHLVPVDRDFSTAGDVPPGTWMVAFGWHMLPLYELRYDFPYHPNVRPLFISFHLSRLEMLTAEAQAYLRRYGPVGCRDWNTVFLLLSAGIDAFFSGCLTTTVDALFPPREAAYRGGGAVGVIDLPRQSAGRGAEDVRVYNHQSDAYRYMSLTDGVRAASALLASYQQDLDWAVTGRLHAYLPLASLGVPVELKTRLPGDVRLAGLTGLSLGDARLTELQAGVRDLITSTFVKVLAGAEEDEVYGSWRDLTANRVAEARARFEAPLESAPTTVDVAASVATGRALGRRLGPHGAVDRDAVTDIALCFDRDLAFPAAVLVESLVANASGALRLWVLGRGLSDAYQEWLAAAFPAVPMTFLPCDQISFGVAGSQGTRARATNPVIDRLLLPLMLAEVDRVVYLDVDTLVLDDICGLARTDLGDRPLAARDSSVSEASVWQRAVRQLAEGPATDLRRWMGVRHGYGHAAFDAGVLVLDLDRMRRADFTATCLGWVEQHGLQEQDAMLAWVGPDRHRLEPRWNALPDLEDVRDPSLIHWAAVGKPWELPLTYGQECWREYAERLRDRAGSAPTGDDRMTSRSEPMANRIEASPVLTPPAVETGV